MGFFHIAEYRINLDHVSHWIDNGKLIDIYSYGQKIATVTGVEAQKFRAAADPRNDQAFGPQRSLSHKQGV
jgi:hypothetical protein